MTKPMRKHTLTLYFAALCALILTSCSGSHAFDTSFFTGQATRDNTPSSQLENPAFWQGSAETIWAKLQQVPLDKLEANQSSGNADAAAWIKLAIISKRYSVDTPQLVRELIAWRGQYSAHPGNQLFPSDSTLNNMLTIAPPKRIAVLLPLKGKEAALGNAVRDGFMSAYYAELSKTATQQTITFYDTSLTLNVASLYQQAANKGADIVIGPLTKTEVRQLTSRGSFSIPTITLNYTDVWFGSLPTNLYQFGLSPTDEAKQIADKAWQTGSSRALIIVPQNEWGQRVYKALSTRWQGNGGTITDTLYFSPQSDMTKEIARLLHVNPKEDRAKSKDQEDKASLERQRRHDFDVIFLLAPPQNAREIVPLLRFYYVDKAMPIYATSSIYSGTPQPQKDVDLNDVVFCDIPWVLNRPAANSSSSNRLFAVGLDSYLISHELPRFNTLPAFPAYAATGALTLTSQKQFYRRSAWALMHDGHP